MFIDFAKKQDMLIDESHVARTAWLISLTFPGMYFVEIFRKACELDSE